MYIRQELVAGGLVLSMTACGMFGENFGSGDESSSVNGREEVTDDWSCESNAAGEWDCYQANPGETGSEADTGAGEPAAEMPQVEADPNTKVAALHAEEVAAAAVSADPVALDKTAGTEGSTGNQAAYVQDNYDWQQLSSDAYVLQLAAHTSRENAQLALTGLDAPGAEIVKTWSDDGDVFVIIAGSYPDKSSAEAAATAYSNRNDGATYWIRSTSNFLKAL